jgi:hypothetical protein
MWLAFAAGVVVACGALSRPKVTGALLLGVFSGNESEAGLTAAAGRGLTNL